MAIGVNWAEIWKPVWKAVWTDVPPVQPPPIVPSNKGAGKARKRPKYQVEVDGEVYSVDSKAAAEAVLAEIREKAAEKAKVAVERAVKAKNRPIGKVFRDAKKALEPPEIEASSAISDAARIVEVQIREIYDSAMRSIEIAAHMAAFERAIEEDDEEILLLL